MPFREEFPFGIEKMTVHLLGQGRRRTINPHDPASVYAGLHDIIGFEITKIVVRPKKDPLHQAWVNAVGRHDTLLSFEEWKEKQ